MSWPHMTIVAAKAMNERDADIYGVNADDQWKIDGEVFISDADAMLKAAGAYELLEALQEAAVLVEGVLMIHGAPEAGSTGHKVRAAIAKATGQPT